MRRRRLSWRREPIPLPVTTSERMSALVSVTVRPSAPAFFEGAILKNADYSIVSAQNPAHSGDVLLAYGLGFGAVAPAVPSARLSPADPLAYNTLLQRVK